MATGTVKYQAPQYGSLAGAVGEKIGSAIQLAAGARRRQNEEIEFLQNKEDKTDEEKQRLLDLISQKQNQEKGFFFKKALGTEFGGDMRRRTMGFFQTDPEDQNDPALSKKKRFDALVASQPAGIQLAPPEPPAAQPAVKQDSGILGNFATNMIEQISLLGKKVDELKKVESVDKTSTAVVKLSENIRNVKSFFSQNNKIEEEKVKIARESLADQKKAQDDAENRAIEDRGEQRDRTAGTEAIDNFRDFLGGDKGGGGLLNTVLDIADVGLDLIGLRKGKRRRRRKGTTTSRRRNSNVRGQTAYSAPIGPQPMNSATPWAQKTAGERGGMFGQSGFVPRMPSRKLASGGIISTPKRQTTPEAPKKLADGGVLDNPTEFGDSAVVPKAQMQTAVKQDPGNAKQAPLFAKLLEIPIVAAGGAMIAKVSSFISGLGGGMVGKLFRPVIQAMFAPAAAAFGLPVNLINAMFGGAASAAEAGIHGYVPPRGGNGKNGTGNATNAATSANTAGISGTAFASNAGSISGYSVTSGFGLRSSPGGIGSTNHQGTDYGIPYGKPISLKMGGKVGTGANDFKAPDTGTSVSGIVTIDHPDGNSTRYVHLSKVNVRPGEEVQAGQVIGEVGGEPGRPGGGGSTGAHLHFEYYPNGGGPANGVAVADKYFAVGGVVTPSASPSQPAAASPPGPSTSAPGAAPAAARGGVGAPIVLPAATPPAARPLTQNSPQRSNLPSQNPEPAYPALNQF